MTGTLDLGYGDLKPFIVGIALNNGDNPKISPLPYDRKAML